LESGERRLSGDDFGMEEIRIMIADDHALLRHTLRRLLSLEPSFSVVGECANGLQVLGTIRNCKPDIVLLDLNMPGMNGLDILEQLHQPDVVTRVILLTGTEDESVLASARKFDFCSIVQKQAGPDALIGCIRLLGGAARRTVGAERK
jgi:DNA-binding NarL/FixJ family response regulator